MRAKELDRDPTVVRAEGFALQDEVAGDELALADAREALYQSEFSRFTRELSAATRERERLERLVASKARRAAGVLKRTAHPAIDEGWRLAFEAWETARNKEGGNNPRLWKQIHQYVAACRAVMDAIEAIKTSHTENPAADVAKLLHSISVQLSPKVSREE